MEQLQQGSPLALLQLPPHQHQHLRPSGGQLVFALRSHRQLRNVLHLLPENGLFSADQPLPGLLPQRHQGGDFDAASLHQPTLQTAFALSVAAVALFTLGSLGNAWHHLLLARLRSTSSEGAKEYKPPTGGLFEYVSTPHYMFELIAWFGIALASEHLNALLVAFSMSSYLSGRSVATSKGNRKRFGKAWPATRGNMIPFLF